MKPEKMEEVLLPGADQSIESLPGCQDLEVVGSVVCGFLNTSGGSLVCGVNDRGDIIGIDDADTAAKNLEQGLLHGISPGALVSVQIHPVGEKRVLVVEVPAGKDLPYAFEHVIYIRDGQTTKKADIETIRDMVLRKQVEPERWERRFSSADTKEDLDEDEIRSTVNAVTERARLQFRDSGNQIMVLEDLGVCRYGRLTNGGDVLFGANPAMRYPQVRVRAACFTTDRADDTYRDMKSFEGPLVPVLEEVYRFIQRNTPTISRFDRDNLNRRDEPLYPVAAIREGLVNAFVHRDYSDFSGGIAVHIYPDRLEIWNAGRFPEGVTPDNLMSGHISVLRNPDIAHVLYLRGLMEMIGRGGVMIRKACDKRGLPPPEWSEDDRGVTLTFYAPEVTPEVTPEVIRMLGVLDGEMSRQDLQDALGLKDNEHFRKAYLLPALRENQIEMTLPDKPKSSKQKYWLTEKGRSLTGQDRS
ncbi:MAG: ATP-dependent helicase RecG [Methanofollis sp.]|nr:ATP-dependent helicase RecG [Methanofollis sp.]